MNDYEAYFIVDKELSTAPLMDDSDRAMIRKWLQKYVDIKNRPANGTSADRA